MPFASCRITLIWWWRRRTVQEIDAAAQKLPVEQVRELQDWLADYLEDDAELNPEFIASIECGPASKRRVGRPPLIPNVLPASFRKIILNPWEEV